MHHSSREPTKPSVTGDSNSCSHSHSHSHSKRHHRVEMSVGEATEMVRKAKGEELLAVIAGKEDLESTIKSIAQTLAVVNDRKRPREEATDKDVSAPKNKKTTAQRIQEIEEGFLSIKEELASEHIIAAHASMSNPLPPTNNITEELKYWCGRIQYTNSTIGIYWQNVCAIALRQLRSLNNSVEELQKYWNVNRIPISFSTVRRMIPVAKLIRDFKRLSFLSDFSLLIGKTREFRLWIPKDATLDRKAFFENVPKGCELSMSLMVAIDGDENINELMPDVKKSIHSCSRASTAPIVIQNLKTALPEVTANMRALSISTHRTVIESEEIDTDDLAQMPPPAIPIDSPKHD